MSELTSIPMFPLSIFPLPGEMVPLHIFEPRYRQLLEDAESRDISFGIYFTHKSNVKQLGSLVKLESVIKRYKTGESDIIVKCIDLFSMDKLFRTYKDKLYPGGQVSFWKVDQGKHLSDELRNLYEDYHEWLKLNQQQEPLSIYGIANELSLDFSERLKFVELSADKQDSFLRARIRYQIELLKKVQLSKDVFHLN